MQAYLKIENPGVAPKEAFTLLGASTSRGNDNGAVIGKFGSGNKHGVATCLRHRLSPVVFAGNLKLEFGTKPVTVDDGLKSADFERVVVKFGGKDTDGKSRSSTEDLGYVLEYGATDWTGVDLALREFVSNAIDRAVKQDEVECLTKYLSETFPNGVERFNQYDADVTGPASVWLKEYRKTAQPWKRVVVEVVNENQVRAKADHTRVFVPLNKDVLEFFENLGKWFLHFSEPESLGKTILPKSNRNLGNRKAAVIYRRGVRVREFQSSDVPSLFDYNLDNLELDEARKVDDWYVRFYAGRALADASSNNLASILQSFVTGTKYWEHEFDTYSLEPQNSDRADKLAQRAAVWKETFEKIAGSDAVLAAPGGGDVAQKKGYKVVTAPESFVKAAARYGVRTPDAVLTADDREGREIIDAGHDARAAVDWVWDVVAGTGMAQGKEKPPVKCFTQIMEAGNRLNGFYRDGVVYINTDLIGADDGRVESLSHKLLAVALEEVAHYVTGATDNSRDFQDYVLNLAVKIAKAKAGVL